MCRDPQFLSSSFGEGVSETESEEEEEVTTTPTPGKQRRGGQYATIERDGQWNANNEIFYQFFLVIFCMN